MKKLIQFILVCTTCALLACSGGGGDDGGGSQSDGPAVTAVPISIEGAIFAFSTLTDSNGGSAISFGVPVGVNKLSITVEAPGSVVKFEGVESSTGTNYLDPGGQMLTTSSEIFRSVSTVNVPSRASDTPIDQSLTLTATVRIGSGDDDSRINPVDSQLITFIINSKGDGDLGSGSLQVNVFYVGAIAQTPESKDAVGRAIRIFREIYSAQAGISLRVSEFDISGPSALPSPISGSSFYLGSTAGAPTPAVNLFIGTDVSAGFPGIAQLLGLSAGIPGPPNPSERSVVAISLLGSRGVDGIFSDAEIQILGETLAHESGHYMGLFHPIELTSDGGVAGLDPLGDTPICGSSDECLSSEELVRNLMFPTPVIGIDGAPISQNQLSFEQGAVMNRYIVVD